MGLPYAERADVLAETEQRVVETVPEGVADGRYKPDPDLILRIPRNRAVLP